MFAGYRHCKKCGKALMGLFDGALCEECEKEENSRMTNEEAIANINMIRVAFVDPVTKEQRKLIDDTLDTAIKALEQEPCEDEYIRVPKKALKYRTAGMVAYNAEWLKKHWQMELKVMGIEILDKYR